jgi:hypothetical protein
MLLSCPRKAVGMAPGGGAPALYGFRAGDHSSTLAS